MPIASQRLAHHVLEAAHPDGRPTVKDKTLCLVVAVEHAAELLRAGYRVVIRSEPIE